MTSSRQRFLDVEDDEELLALQEQMRRSIETPAATVRRVTRKPPSSNDNQDASSGAAPPSTSSNHQHSTCTDPNCTHEHHHNQIQPSMDNLLSSMQNALKGIVGEVQERTTATAPLPPKLPTIAGKAGSFPEAVHRKQSKFALARKKTDQEKILSRQQPPPPPVLPVDMSQATEEEQISAETSAIVSSMSAEQVAEAREDILSRLTPEMAEFLRKRGEKKTAAETAKASSSRLSGDREPSSSSSKETTKKKEQLSSATATKKTTNEEEKKKGFDTSLQQPKTSPTAAVIAAHLRFDVSGQVVGFKPLNDSIRAVHAELAAIVSRDPLRQAEGKVAADGYTVEEAAVLVRSSLPQQRVFALKTLTSILTKTKPQSSSLFSHAEDDGNKVPISADILGLILTTGARKESFGVKWIDIWRHALHAAQVALIIRHALDDTYNAVITAASEALLALLSPNAVEESLTAAANSNPVIGWPAVPHRHLQRPNNSAQWVSAPVDLQFQRTLKNQANIGEEGEDDDDDVDEKELAKVDPLTGLLNMQMLERIAYVLGVLKAPGAAAPLLKLVAVISGSCGQDVAKKVAQTPQMLDSIYTVLEENSSSDGENGGLRVLALKTVCSLCQSSLAAAKSIANYPGLLSQHVLPLLLKEEAVVDGENSKVFEAVLEALKIWRSLSLHGLHLLSADDAYPALCRHLNPSYIDSLLLERETELSWAAAREALLSLAQARAASSSRSDMDEHQWISRECANSVADQTLEWLKNTSASLPGKLETNNNNKQLSIVLSTLSAALYYLTTHYQCPGDNDEEEAKKERNRAQEELFSSSQGSSLCTVLKTVLDSTFAQIIDAQTTTTSMAPPFEVFTAASATALALSQLESTLLLVDKNTSTQLASKVVLEPFIGQECIQLLATVLSLKPGSTSETLLQPWDAPSLQLSLQISRCIAASGSVFAEEEIGNFLVAALLALRCLPPGSEDTALQLLGHCLSSKPVKRALSAAHTYIKQHRVTLLSKEETAAVEMPPSKIVGKVLLAGIAASWFGFIQEDLGDNEEEGGVLPKFLISKALLTPEGSSLPLPHNWTLQHLLTPPPASFISALPSLSTAYALLWSLGCLTQELDYAIKVFTIEPQAAVQFVFDQTFYMSQSHRQEKEEEDEIWQEPLVRTSFAALLHYSMSNLTETTRCRQLTIPEAQRIVENFCASSLGDPLFGAAVSLLFDRHLAPLEIQLEALAGLIDGHALYLLPTVEQCCLVIGEKKEGKFALLNPPSPLNSSTTTTAAGLLKTANDVETYMKVIASREAGKCVEMGSAIFSIVVHRLAAKIFNFSSNDSSKEDISKTKQAALLNSVIRRLNASILTEQERSTVLSSLLRWSCDEGAAIDVVSAERMEFIKTALDDEQLYTFALRSLEA